MLHIIAGEEKVKKTDGNEAKALSSFQRERQQNLKENASKTQHTWNSLFLGTNAIAENLAESYEIEKRHLLLDQGESRFLNYFIKILLLKCRRSDGNGRDKTCPRNTQIPFGARHKIGRFFAVTTKCKAIKNRDFGEKFEWKAG